MPHPYHQPDQAEGSSKELPSGDKPITIGRHPTNMVVISDTMASRYHCVIEKGQDGLRVRDLDSSNGTRVNGQGIKTFRLGDGDVVQIGRSTITVHAPQYAPSPRPVAVAAPDEEEFEVQVVEI